MTNSILIKRLIMFWELIKILQNAKIKKKEKVNSHSNTLYKKTNTTTLYHTKLH